MKARIETMHRGRDSSTATSRRIKLMLAIDGLGLGGAEVVVRDLAHKLDRSWLDVCVCCTKGLGGSVGEELRKDGFDLFVLPGYRHDRNDYRSSLEFRRAVIKRKIDIIHTHAASALFDAAYCKLTTPKVKTIHTFHFGNYPYSSWRHHILEGTASRVMDKLVAVGLEQRRKIISTYRLQESKVGMIWNGVRPPVSRAPRRNLRDELRTGDRLLVGTVAKLINQKGLEDFLIVARRCLDAGHRMQFVIVGDGELRGSLEQRRLELGLGEAVIFAGWIPDAAAKAVPAFDVFFQSSRWEAMSIVILEAMACGKAIVATRVGDNPHVLRDGASGLLVDSGDVDAMVQALGRMEDPGLRQVLGSAARVDFESKFAVEHMVEDYESVYRELAGC